MVMIYFKDASGGVYAYSQDQIDDGCVIAGFVKMTPTEIDAHLNPVETTEQLASRARSKRDTLLLNSDWTQVADSPADKQVWAVYRQSLRDITDQPGFPTDITWPEVPNG